MLQYLFSWPVFWVVMAFAFNVATGVFGINGMTLRRAWPWLSLGGVLAVAAAWQTAQQAYDSDTKYSKLEENLTGGTSFPEVIPEGHDNVSLVILNTGHSILPNVSIMVLHGFEHIEQKTVNVGTLAPSETPNYFVLPLTITPSVNGDFSTKIDGEEMDIYLLLINAPNGTTVEDIEFKKGKCAPWASRYSIKPPQQLNKPNTGFTEWSDGKC